MAESTPEWNSADATEKNSPTGGLLSSLVSSSWLDRLIQAECLVQNANRQLQIFLVDDDRDFDL